MKSLRKCIFGKWLNSRPSQNTTLTASRVIAAQLDQLATHIGLQDAVFERQAYFRLQRMSQQLSELLRYELSFSQTETWRIVYEAILSACQVKRYLSVALVETEDYWRDPPGQASLEFNFDLVQHGFHVHRRFIIDDYFWPPRAVRPATEVFSAIQQQAAHGIEVSLIRKSQLETEPQLVRDLGIYGERAVGYQSLDEQGRTTAYKLCFGRQAIETAEELWRQLDLFAVSWEELLDRPI
jgi:hypothetical protein